MSDSTAASDERLLDGAIVHCREVAGGWRRYDGTGEVLACVREHEQLAGWLSELKERRVIARCGRDIDDLSNDRPEMAELVYELWQERIPGVPRCHWIRLTEGARETWRAVVARVRAEPPEVP